MNKEEQEGSAATDQDKTINSQGPDSQKPASFDIERDQTIRADLTALKISRQIAKPREWLIKFLIEEHDCTQTELFNYLRFFAEAHHLDWNNYAIEKSITNYGQTNSKITKKQAPDPELLPSEQPAQANSASSDQQADLSQAAEATSEDETSDEADHVAEKYSAELSGKKPAIRTPGEGWIAEKFINRFLPILERAKVEIFNYHGQCVLWRKPARLDEPHLIPVSPQMFRGLIEEYSLPFTISRRGSGRAIAFEKSIAHEHAGMILEHPSFLKDLRALCGVDEVRLPILRGTNRVDLLPEGYDQVSGIYIPKGFFKYRQDLSLTEAREYMRELLRGACFLENDQDRAVTIVIAEMLTLFCRHFFSQGSLRPGFVYSANSEGAGKSRTAFGYRAPSASFRYKPNYY